VKNSIKFSLGRKSERKAVMVGTVYSKIYTGKDFYLQQDWKIGVPNFFKTKNPKKILISG